MSDGFTTLGYTAINGSLLTELTELSVIGSESTETFITGSSINAVFESNPIRIVGIVVGIFSITFGVIGNMLTIAAVITYKKLHKPFFIFVANLGFVDLLTASLMLPFNVAAYYQRRWPFGNTNITCSLMAFWYYYCGYTSIVWLVVIAANRCIGVVRPIKYKQLFTRRGIIITIIISWIFAAIFLIPNFFFGNGNGYGYGWGAQITLCVFLTVDYTQNEIKYMLFTRVLFQIFPVLAMIVLYSLIFITSHRSISRVTKYSKESPKTADADRCTKESQKSFCFFKKRSDSPEPDLATKMASARNPDTAIYSDNQTTSSFRRSKEVPIAVSISPPSVHKRENTLTFHPHHSSSSLAEFSSSPVEKDVLKSSASYPIVNKFIENKRRFQLNSFTDSLEALNEVLTKFSKNKEKQKESKTIYFLRKKRKKRENRLIIISVTMCVAFMVTFLPSVIVSFTSYRNWLIYPQINMIVSVISWFNSCINPFIYWFMNARLRKQYRNLLYKIWSVICWKKYKYGKPPSVATRTSTSSVPTTSRTTSTSNC